MKAIGKILIGAGAAFGLYKVIGFTRKAANIPKDIYVNADILAFKLISPLVAAAKFRVAISSVSQINVSITNVFSRLLITLKDNSVLDVGVSQVTPKVVISNNQPAQFETSFNVSYLSIVGKIVTGKVQSIQLVTNYDLLGQPMNYKTTIDVSNFITKAKSIIGLSGGDTTNLL